MFNLWEEILIAFLYSNTSVQNVKYFFLNSVVNLSQMTQIYTDNFEFFTFIL